MRVVAKNKDAVVFSDIVTVSMDKNNIYCNVNIMWEEKISDNERKERSLFGYYSSMYYEISFNNDMLRIRNHDGIDIEIIGT